MGNAVVIEQQTFQLDALGEQEFEGYSIGQYWNGWACPLFTYSQAVEIMLAWRLEGWSASYDTRSDEFRFGPEVYGAMLIGGIKVYPVGAAVRTWSEAETEQADYSIVPDEDFAAGYLA